MPIMASDKWVNLDNRGLPFLHCKDSRIFQVLLQSPSLSLWYFEILAMKLWSMFIASIEQVGNIQWQEVGQSLLID